MRSRPVRPPGVAVICRSASLDARARAALRRIPALSGRPLCLETRRGLRDKRGPVHAGSFLRQRRIVFDCAPAEFSRIFVHELFHFVWLRLGNPARRSYEVLLASERPRRGGELGWSAEWRKDEITSEDVRMRSRRWREYCCESFCDTAAWLYSGAGPHPEFTLAARFRARRRAWFAALVKRGALSI